jgi:protein involved in polysaccharide export with SLBB domain
MAMEPVVEIKQAGANSRLVITFSPDQAMTAEELQELEDDPVLSRLTGSQNFVLDDSGVLSLLGTQSIPLLGLTESDIERRLGAEPLLSRFDIDARILDSTPTGVAALKPFGYDIFEPTEASFDPPMTGPVPPDYVLGPGDTVRVQLFGNVNGIYEFDVTRDGILNLPEIGPVTVAGLPFSEFRQDLNRRVKEMLIGTQVSVTMGQLRTIRVFVLGDANRPGSYVVDSLATMSSALYRSGGISRVGSLRDIQLKRSGKIVARLDLYDLLLKGDTSGDSRLQPGDVIFVSPIGTQISVVGAVKRPAIYETRGKATVSDVIAMAGGLLPDAYPDGARIERFEGGQERIVISIDADSAAATSAVVSPGDVVLIPDVLPAFEDVVTLTGHVHRPGPYQWRAGMRLTDLVGSALELKPGADANYMLIRREHPVDRQVSVVSANLSAALAEPGSSRNIALAARDTVHVFSLEYGRQRVIQPILQELKLQSRIGEPYREVSISGFVKAPGTYALESGMRVSDLIRAGGDLAEQAYALKAELARYEVIDSEYRNTTVVDVDLEAILRGTQSADVVLQEHDNLRISAVPDWDSLWTVELGGEVTFPGSYRIRRGETLRQVLERAGGLTEEAFAEGAVFLRESLRAREQQQIDMLSERLEADLTSLSLENANTAGADTLTTGQTLLSQLRSTKAVGRLVIDLELIAGGDAANGMIGNIELRDGDQLLIPKKSEEVTVIGETQQNTSHLYQPGLSKQDYINMSGGLTRRADKKLIYVVRASGAVISGKRSKWFGRGGGTEIRPGDTVVVPVEIDRIRPLTFWGQVTQILYQAAIAVAAVDSFGK